MRVLGLDPGSRRTGYGVVERHGNRFTCVKHGTVAPAGGLDLAHRLHAIAVQIEALVAEVRPDVVAVEEAFYHENVRSTLVLGHVRGVLLVAAVRHDCAVAEYTPREIKLSVAGRGGATKDQVSFMVRRLLDVRGELAVDAGDALATALCHLQRARLTPPARAASVAARRLEALLTSRGTR
ncbi:MAG: crossover junction endodeoxyribonuclease RuvC [Candidatus Eisenbacteria bacterium]|uniref:Crossover junction endodeoxyribonuclease RuvC n=1 Tax=Eiseniibacteriota bacterium TaxID=2212470 RepID=A0A849SGV1_UNCEI|nr:crossover junction endodeoxyribonuclease RuvC [Candidatus Eisenbacteria bacterium]